MPAIFQKLRNTIAVLATHILYTPNQRTYQPPDLHLATQLAHDDLAPPLPASEMERWKWFSDPLTRWGLRTDAQQRRAECGRQPTIGDCLYLCDGNRTTFPRARPKQPTPDPDRPRNDYDHLLDVRVLSPNNKIVGFRDYDRDEIARENAFTPPVEEDEEDEVEEVEWVPEEGSLESRMYPSLMRTPPQFARPQRRRVPPPVPQHQRTSGLTDGEVIEFVEVFRTLPYCCQQDVLVNTRLGIMGCVEAVEGANKHKKRCALVPGMQRIYDQVRKLQDRASKLVEGLQGEGEVLLQSFREAVVLDWPRHQGKADVEQVLGEYYHNNDQTVMFVWREDDDDVQVVAGMNWYYAVVELVETQGMSLQLRQRAVQKLLSMKRLWNVTEFVDDIDDWFKLVGNRDMELRGMYERGDFWGKVQEEWARLLEQAEWEWCVKTDREAGEMSLGELAEVRDGRYPVRPRAGWVMGEE